MSPSRYRKLAAVAAVAPWVAVAIAVAKGRAPRGWLGWDLASFRVAAKLLASGHSLYDFAAQSTAYHAEFGRGFDVLFPFAYPPIFAIEMLPLAHVPQAAAWALVFVASLAAVSFAVRAITGDARDAVWVLGTFPGLVGLLAGQFSFFALGLVVLAWTLLERQRSLEAGLALSVLAFKPQLLLFLPLALLFRRDWRALLGLALGAGIQVALCFAVAPHDTLAFPGVLRAFAGYARTHFDDDWSFTWRAFFALLAPGHSLATEAAAAGAVAICAWAGVRAMWRARRDLALCFGAAVLTTLCAAWHAYPYDWVLLAFPFFLLLPRARPSRAVSVALPRLRRVVDLRLAAESRGPRDGRRDPPGAADARRVLGVARSFFV